MHEKATILTRREFARRAGTVALVPLAAGMPAWTTAAPGPAPSPNHEESSIVHPGDAPARPLQESQEKEEPPGADALLAYLRERYGERLTEEDLSTIRQGIVGNLRAANRIREVELANSDEPGVVFRAFRGGTS